MRVKGLNCTFASRTVRNNANPKDDVAPCLMLHALWSGQMCEPNPSSGGYLRGNKHHLKVGKSTSAAKQEVALCCAALRIQA